MISRIGKITHCGTAYYICMTERLYATSENTAHSAVTDMNIQRMTPWISGLKPTDRNTLPDRPAPIRKRVTVKPALATDTMYGVAG